MFIVVKWSSQQSGLFVSPRAFAKRKLIKSSADIKKTNLVWLQLKPTRLQWRVRECGVIQLDKHLAKVEIESMRFRSLFATGRKNWEIVGIKNKSRRKQEV